MSLSRADLFRLLGDEDRLRLLALCAEEELTVSELAHLIGESQPQITKKSQPLREAGLLASRRDGTRTLLKAEADAEPVVAEAIAEGRRLCSRDGSLAKVARVVAEREELSRHLFEQPHGDSPAPVTDVTPFVNWLPMIAPLLPGRALAIDAGTGEGELLPILSLLYDRVIAVDRSASRLARCALRINPPPYSVSGSVEPHNDPTRERAAATASFRLSNVRLREGSIEDASLAEEVAERGGADLVVMARVLHHIGKPQELITAATKLLRSGGHLAVIDYLPHDDESLREQGHVWLGFDPQKLRIWLEQCSLAHVSTTSLAANHHPPVQLAIGKKPMRAS